MLNFHKVWFVFGAVEFEVPVCVRSWRHMGHESSEDCALEKPKPPLELVAPAKIVTVQTETKNSTTKAKHAVVVLLTFSFLLSRTLVSEITLIANQNAI